MPLTLAMIVKNEAEGIVQTLQSAKPWIDRWVILDTGSTDNTKALIEAELDGIPGQVIDLPFVDFATTRNALLDACRTDEDWQLLLDAQNQADNDWLLLLDADDVLEGGAVLKGFISASPEYTCYHLWIQLAGSKHCLPRLVKATSDWWYTGAVHEVLSCPGQYAQGPLDGVLLDHRRTPLSSEASQQRWRRDVALLQGAVDKDPTDTRSVFYLARTWDALGEWTKAAAVYIQRSRMGGWDEECYMSLLGAGRCLQKANGDWPYIQQQFLDAYALRPDRAEALCELAAYYVRTQQWPLAYLFARKAYEIALPVKAILFVEEAAHTWWPADLLGTAAWYVGDKALGQKAAHAAAILRTDNKRIQDNLRFYDE